VVVSTLSAEVKEKPEELVLDEREAQSAGLALDAG